MRTSTHLSWGARVLLTILLVILGSSSAQAMNVDVFTVFSNAGLETGNLDNWSITKPNANYVSGLSVSPNINPADPLNDLTPLAAPAGSFFTGVTRPGDSGPDLAYKIAHDATAVSFAAGTTFSVGIFGNRGRLEPFDTPGSTAELRVRIFGWGAGSTPTVNSSDDWSRNISWKPGNQSFDFSGIADGDWGFQIFTFDPAALGIDAADLEFLSLSITGNTKNHDQYVASDLGTVPEPTTWLLLGAAILGLGALHRRS